MDSRVRGNDKRARALRRLFAEWKKFSLQLEWECSEDEARHRWANETLKSRKSKVESWRDLTLGEINRLIREISERSGSAAAYRAKLIALAAAELWGSQWNTYLELRLWDRFQLSTLDFLTPSQAHSLLEELVSRIARERGEGIEAVRQRVQGSKLKVESQDLQPSTLDPLTHSEAVA